MAPRPDGAPGRSWPKMPKMPILRGLVILGALGLTLVIFERASPDG